MQYRRNHHQCTYQVHVVFLSGRQLLRGAVLLIHQPMRWLLWLHLPRLRVALLLPLVLLLAASL